MAYKVTVSSKGQIVIPVELRRRYEIEQGDELVLMDDGGHIKLLPPVEDPIEDARGSLAWTGMTMADFHALRHAERDREDEKTAEWLKKIKNS